MSINSVLSAGLQGVQAGLDRSNRAGGQIAASGANADSGDLVTPAVDLKLGKIQVQAAANVIKAADQMLGTLIDTKA